MTVLADDRRSRGEIEAGLAQFGKGTRLAGCAPDAAALDLSDNFANFLVADDRSAEGGNAVDSQAAETLASQLAEDFYHIAEADGSLIPLLDGVGVRALGSVRYRFTFVLVYEARSRSVDVIITRETQGTKFAPQLAEPDRRASRLKWSSLRDRRQASRRATFACVDSPGGIEYRCDGRSEHSRSAAR